MIRDHFAFKSFTIINIQFINNFLKEDEIAFIGDFALFFSLIRIRGPPFNLLKKIKRLEEIRKWIIVLKEERVRIILID